MTNPDTERPADSSDERCKCGYRRGHAIHMMTNNGGHRHSELCGCHPFVPSPQETKEKAR